MIYLLPARCRVQQSGPSCYRSFSSDLILTAKRNASLKLMQYFLSYLSLSYQFVLSSRNKSKWCTITTAALHRLLEIVTTVTSFHRNDGGNLFWMMMIRVILVTSGQWSGWHWLVSFVSFMTSYSLQWWLWNIEMCNRYDETVRDASLNHISRPISRRKIKLVLAELGLLCRTLFAEGADRISHELLPGVILWLAVCCDTTQPTQAVSGVMVTVRH